MSHQQHPSYRQVKRARRKARREAKRTERHLLRQIKALIPKAIRESKALDDADHITFKPYRRWSSRSRLGKLFKLGRTVDVRFWAIPGTYAPQGGQMTRQYVLTSNRRIVALHYGRLYARKRIEKVASAEDLRVILSGVQVMVGVDVPTS